MNLIDVVTYCQQHIGDRAKRYLSNRGVSDKSIKDFGLGYCPFETDELVCSIGLERLIELGIAYKRDDTYVCPNVRNSISFPLFNQYNRLMSISFRTMQSNEVIKEKHIRKYWHVSFKKSVFLYGLWNALPFIRQEEKVIVGEGQLDVIMAHQYGIRNTVGVCGTQLSVRQVSILARYTSEIIIVFDGDAAGQKSLQKVKKKQLPGTTIKTVTLPVGEDIDSYLRSFGEASFRKLIATAV
jgi:DNA primase